MKGLPQCSVLIGGNLNVVASQTWNCRMAANCRKWWETTLETTVDVDVGEGSVKLAGIESVSPFTLLGIMFLIMFLMSYALTERLFYVYHHQQ